LDAQELVPRMSLRIRFAVHHAGKPLERGAHTLECKAYPFSSIEQNEDIQFAVLGY
jgi:hypothetical protein